MPVDERFSPMDDIANMFSVDDYMYFYADFLTPARSDAETAYVIQLLGMDPRRGSLQVLDLACGFGRIANRLALVGHNVLGVEYQPGFLAIARAEADRNNLLRPRPAGWVKYQQGDMRAIDYENQFDRVLMLFNSFGYFPDAENLLVLQKVTRALKPGGLLGFDVTHRDGVLNDFHRDFVSEKEGNLLINRFSFDVQTGRLHNDRIIIRGGKRRDVPFSYRLYSLTEIRSLLSHAGLELNAFYSEWDGSPLEPTSSSMVIIARKPEDLTLLSAPEE